ncbi:hypothetical protein AMTR_s00003p00112870 [Amborella trichopoda]|uniref:Uncharacterized protein n=1 Tax=Amborella trichopoda TaxID=13333 RepID=W1P6C5_AMBTC|nr:hypothetical protein AMTR_s00003p00112870 [Amborella trichopoda]
MFPLFYRIAARRTPSSTRPKFDPLLIDPLEVIVLDDMDDSTALDGEALHPARDVPPPVAEEVDTGLRVVHPNCVLVVVDALPPLAVFHFDVNPMFFHLTAAPVHPFGFLTVDLAPTMMPHEVVVAALYEQQRVAGQVMDCGLDYDVPIAMVFKDMLDKKKDDKVDNSGALPSNLAMAALSLRAGQGRDKSIVPAKGTRSSTRLQAREERV